MIGANHVTNPIARRPGHAIFGMPVLDVDRAENLADGVGERGGAYARGSSSAAQGRVVCREAWSATYSPCPEGRQCRSHLVPRRRARLHQRYPLPRDF
ncbi:hypothetical protein [Streptomyces sp. NPDC059786]|uniref:hypothetical protein n=1 Tax=Streptomyces sp. NPDC059786 TaxID=3346946 RepID=UPI00365F852C